jgi:hypothetical protein
LIAATCCRGAKFSMTRLSRDRHMTSMARTPSKMMKMRKQTMAVIAVTACVEYRTLVSGASSNYTAVSHASGYRYKCAVLSR